jgi:hypothetical protein
VATNKRITDVDFLDSLNSNESFFVNQNNTLKQINKSNIVFDITNGGTGASDATTARNNLGITPANIGVYTKAEVDSAISVVKATGISVCTHTKTGNVHALVGDANADNLKFSATADFVDGDTFTFNGNKVEAKTADGEPVCSGVFATNSVVMCFVANDGTLFFKGGASSGNGKLPIVVKADTGSTVTCSNGIITKTLIASEGKCVFKNMDVGTWTIVSTLNNREKIVDYELKIPEVEVLYLKHLYNNGDEFEDVTGGWVDGSGRAMLTKTDTTMQFSSNSASMAYCTSTKNKIDVTEYSTLHFVLRTINGYEHQILLSNFDGSPVAAVKGGSGAEFAELTLDISDVTGEWHIAFGNNSPAYESGYTEVSEVWLD